MAQNPQIPEDRYDLYVAAAITGLIIAHPMNPPKAIALTAHDIATQAVDEQRRRESLAKAGYTNLYALATAGLSAFAIIQNLLT